MNNTKIIAFCILSALSFHIQNAMAQEGKEPPVTLTLNETTGFSFEKIIDLPSVTKEQAYDRIKQWVVNNLKTADNNISFDDKDKNGITSSTGILLDLPNGNPLVSFKIIFSFKENKMKIAASQFVYSYLIVEAPFDKLPKNYRAKAKTTIYENFDEKFSALISAAQIAASKKDEKW